MRRYIADNDKKNKPFVYTYHSKYNKKKSGCVTGVYCHYLLYYDYISA